MRRRGLSLFVVASIAAICLFVLGAFLFSGRAHASWGRGMMNGSGYRSGMTGGYGYGMMGHYGTTGSAVLMIRHQRARCHSWSLNGGPFKAAQSLTMKAGSSLTIVDNDVMPHRLSKLSGSAVTMRNGTLMPMMNGYVSHTPGLMNHMGARTTVTFGTPGVYRFRTKAGEDFMPGIETTGEDNTLRLTVTVTA